jgi:MFS transporter, UMF1 family
MLKSPRSQIAVWTLFDFANTSFSVLIVTVGFSLYFKEVLVGGGEYGDFLWGVTVSISMLLTALISPVLGAASDYSHRKKQFLFIFTIVSILCTTLMVFLHAGMVAEAMVLFILANIGFEGGLVFYDAFLPGLTTERSYGRVSGYGFAMGYVGSLATLLIAMPLYQAGFVPSNLPSVRLSFVIAALFFLVFSLPLFLFLTDQSRSRGDGVSYVREGIRRVNDTVKHLRQYKNIARFLLAFFLYNDGILSVIAFSSLFARTSLGFSLQEVLMFFAVVQTTAILGSILFGVLTDHYGPKKTITLSLLIWCAIVVGAFFVESKSLFYVIGLFAGACLGGTQSASRSFMARLTPKEREAEFFGFYDGLCGKASAVLGTFLFGFISYLTGSERFAVLSIGAFFLIGLLLLQRVKEHTPAQQNYEKTFT